MQAVLLGILVVGGAYAIAASIIGAGLFEGLIGTFFGFFISLGIMMLVAKVLGGVGDWRTFAYAIAVFDVPLGIADAAAIIIPVIGALIAVLGIAYYAYLTILAASSVHRLPTGKSIIVALVLPAFLAVASFCTFAVEAIVFLASAIR
jgi:hypothetical protein